MSKPILIHRQEVTTAKDLIYPERKHVDKTWHMKNMQDLKLLEEKNLQKQKEKENYVEPTPYKLKQFQNVKSKLYEQTKEWIANEQKNLNYKKPKSQMQSKKPDSGKLAPLSCRNVHMNQNSNINNVQNIPEIDLLNNEAPYEAKSMFEKYYENKLRKSRSKSPENIYNINKNIYNNNNRSYEENIYNNQNKNINNPNNIPESYPLNKEENINDILKNNNLPQKSSSPQISSRVEELIKCLPPEASNLTDEELDLLLKKYNDDLQKQIADKEKEINNLNNEINKYENKKDKEKEHLKGPTPKPNECPLILPKIQRNYLLENRKLITDHKIQQKKTKEIKDNAMHKDYGKTPEYLERYKKEAEIKKEILKKKKEEAKYPKGTKLLSEEERLSTLNGLKNTQKELNNLLEKMPITTRTMAIQNRKKELEDKLSEVEKAIDMFSKKQVFVKIQ